MSLIIINMFYSFLIMIDYISFLGIFLSVIVFKYTGNKNRQNIFLAGFFLSLSLISIFRNTVFFVKNPFMVSFLAPISIPFFYSAAPMLFLYVKNLYQLGGMRFRKIDYFHFFPMILVFLNFLPQLLLTSNEKAKFYQIVIQNPFLLFEIKHLVFSLKLNLLIRPLYFLIYIIASLLVIIRSNKRSEFYQNKSTSTNFTFTLIALFSIQTLVILATAITINFYDSNNVVNSKLAEQIAFLQSILSVAILFVIFLFPNMIYGVFENQRHQMNNKLINADFSGGLYIEKHYIETAQILEKYYLTKPYLQAGFNLTLVAKDTKIPYHQISLFYQIYLKKNFSEWKNFARIDYALELINNGQASKITIEAIANECGYVSRSNFNLEFMKVTGLKPSEYVKKVDFQKKNELLNKI